MLFQTAEELPKINNHAFSIVSREIFDVSTSPLVCDANEESIKADATLLLRQLVSLKQKEMELMRQGAHIAGAAVCDDEMLQRIASTLNVQVPLTGSR